jgi:DNA-binding transcriptional LysR family regulator
MPGYVPELSVIPLVSEPLALACPPDHRFASRRYVRLKELEGAEFVDLPRGWGARESVDRLFSAHGLTREVVVEVPDASVIRDLVLAGVGFAFLSPSLLGTSSRVALVPVRPFAEFAVALISSTDRPLSAAARKFVELTMNTYPQP